MKKTIFLVAGFLFVGSAVVAGGARAQTPARTWVPMQAPAQIKPIVDKRVDAFKTRLQVAGFFFWIRPDQLVATVAEEGVNYEYHLQEIKTRIALVDFSKKTIQYIVRDGCIVDYNRRTGVLLINELHGHDPVRNPCNSGRSDLYTSLREIKVKESGETETISEWPLGKWPKKLETDYPSCRGPRSLDEGRDGFLVAEMSAGESCKAQFQRLSEGDESWPTAWVRDGQPALPIAVRFDEIQSEVYLAFKDAYLLDDADTAMTSNGNAHLAGAKWKRRYEYTPFRLLHRDGSIEEIPYPQFVFDYGLSKPSAGRDVHANFDSFLPTRDGIVVTANFNGDEGIFLFKGDRLYRIAGAGHPFGPSVDNIGSLTLSPDGCRIAYDHLERGPIDRFFENNTSDPMKLTIIDVCGKP